MLDITEQELEHAPAQLLKKFSHAGSGVRKVRASSAAQYTKAIATIALVTLAAFGVTPLVGAHATALLYLLTVVLLALFVDRGPTLVAAAMSAVVCDFFFLPPVFAFRINHFEDAMLLGMYFIVALVLGHLTTRIRAQQAAERQREARATALYLLTRDLNESISLDQMVQRIVIHAHACFDAKVALLLPSGGSTLVAHRDSTLQLPQNELPTLQWLSQSHTNITSHPLKTRAHFVPLITVSGPVGALALGFEQPSGPTVDQENLLDAFCHQIAMALDRLRLNGISERAKLLAESERLSKTLLDSMSHEIRTPIAAIKSATGNLSDLSDSDSTMRRQMLAEIQEATERLNRLVGNVLEASRLESGTVKPRFNECHVDELVNLTLAELEKEMSAHQVTVRVQPGLPLVWFDFVLMQQSLANLLTNAAFHTPSGTSIEIDARLENESLLLSVADRGPGIPPDCLPRIFDKFFRVPNSRTGGTGLGLSLVKGFVEAHSGKVTAQNRPGGGTVFTISLPQSQLVCTPAEAAL